MIRIYPRIRPPYFPHFLLIFSYLLCCHVLTNHKRTLQFAKKGYFVSCTSDLFLSSSATATENPAYLKMSALPYFYYDGDCNDPNTQATIKSNFYGLMTSGLILPLFCTAVPDDCNVDTIEVYCGNVTSAERRRKRSSTNQVPEGLSEVAKF